MTFSTQQLSSYLVIGTQDLLAGQDLLALIEIALESGVTMVQYREKGASTFTNEDKLVMAKQIHKLTAKYHVPLVIDDDVDLAISIHAEGLHVGQGDEPIKQVVHRVQTSDNPDMFIGLSVSTLAQLEQSGDLTGVSYLGIGPVYTTGSKNDADPEIGLAGLVQLRQATSLPLVAIGGITFADAPVIAATGVNGVAMISAFTHAKKGELQQAIKTLNQLFAHN